MFFSNLLVLVVGVATVSARVIGGIRPSSSKTPILTPECNFHPQNQLTHSISQKPISPDAYTNIPSHAWPLITSLLLTHSNPLTSALPISRNNVQTLRLSLITKDVTLERIVLGLVFTTPDNNVSGNLELRSDNVVDGEGQMDKMAGQRMCVEQAIRNVEVAKQVEGSLDIEGRGKMGFLVYRDD